MIRKVMNAVTVGLAATLAATLVASTGAANAYAAPSIQTGILCIPIPVLNVPLCIPTPF